MTRRAILLFAALGVAWGIPYLLIKIAVGEISPAMVVLGRTALAAVLLIPLALARHEVMPVLRKWPLLIAYTLCEIVLPWFFLSTAEQHLTSSISGLLIAAVPLVGVGVAFAMRRAERMAWWNWIGILVGMAGVAALVGLDVSGSDLGSVAELIVVVVGYAVGPAIMAHWMNDLPSLGVVALSLAGAAIVYIPFVTLTGEWPTAWPSWQVILSVVLLAVVCSAIAFLLMFQLVREVGPVRSTVITYLNPAVAITAGAIVLHEPITVWTIVGFVLVLGGSYLVTRKQSAPALPPQPEAAPAIEPPEPAARA